MYHQHTPIADWAQAQLVLANGALPAGHLPQRCWLLRVELCDIAREDNIRPVLADLKDLVLVTLDRAAVMIPTFIKGSSSTMFSTCTVTHQF